MDEIKYLFDSGDLTVFEKKKDPKPYFRAVKYIINRCANEIESFIFKKKDGILVGIFGTGNAIKEYYRISNENWEDALKSVNLKEPLPSKFKPLCGYSNVALPGYVIESTIPFDKRVKAISNGEYKVVEKYSNF